jgi:signal transduction histidine kinase
MEQAASDPPLMPSARRMCGAGAIFLGLTGLAGWSFDAPPLITLELRSIPIAPNTAVAFVATGICLWILAGRALSRRRRWVVRTVAGAMVVLVSVRLIEFASNVSLSSDKWIIAVPHEPGETIQIGRMAFHTAFNFWLTGVSLVLLTCPVAGGIWSRHVVGACSIVTALIGTIFFLGYLYGSPYLSGESFIPMALNTAIGFMVVGLGLSLSSGREVVPWRYLAGPGVRARLLKAFLPATALVVFLVAWLMYNVSQQEEASSVAALLSAALTVMAVFLIGLLCAHIASDVGDKLEQTEQGLRDAEQRSRSYADELQVLNATLERRVAARTRDLQVSRDHLEERNRLLQELAESERQTHEELKRAQTQLVESEKLAALGQLVAGVAHEINNPLAFVANNVAVLQRDIGSLRELLSMYQDGNTVLADRLPELAARIRDLATRIDLAYTLGSLDRLLYRSRDGLKRIQQIVKDLRDFARLDASDLQEVDLNAGIASTVNIVLGQAKKQQVTLQMDLGALPPVTCYPAKINQVILNLLTNAIDACPDNGRITVGTRTDGDQVAIVVEDNGTGIDPTIRDKIFDPFFTTKPQGKGTGLGLSISYGIVQGHGGTIDVASRPGEGTRFTVRLPTRSANSRRELA